MLLFIQCDHCPTHRIARFQNILCYCLSIQGITLAGMFFEFQNILCYCLSRLRGRIFSGKLDFKTSYVIVYRPGAKDVEKEVSFQNILCYCLSDGTVVIDTEIDTFQNILCYCLSLAFPRFLVSPLPFFPLYFLYFSIFYQPTPLSWTALLIIP